jgi:hypothetical protein
MNNSVVIALIAFISSSAVLIILSIFKVFYASKCKSFGICWGCIQVKDRDTINEQSIRNLEIPEVKIPIEL